MELQNGLRVVGLKHLVLRASLREEGSERRSRVDKDAFKACLKKNSTHHHVSPIFPVQPSTANTESEEVKEMDN